MIIMDLCCLSSRMSDCILRTSFCLSAKGRSPNNRCNQG
ncbi:Uncharacterised protein [Vibrio cholerae]|nr:Uncharacterised protein [Vibrio cholerae]